MKIAVPKELHPDESRVALVPVTVKKLVDMGLDVVIETGAGAGSYFSDEEYKTVGAQIAKTPNVLYDRADVVLKVRPPFKSDKTGKNEIDLIPKGSVLICFLETLRNPQITNQLIKRDITSFSMDTIPRISRAQSMDALSSQASAAGYKAVLLAATALPKFFPMLTTAAGTIPPAKVFIIGAGVAGLQAIATARRLGANVEGFDIRPAAKGEVESLGARFVSVDLEKDTAAEGGYAKEVTKEDEEKEHRMIHDHVAGADVVVTTAQVPGKKAPLLVTKGMVKDMKPGSVIVDLAVEQGGNCELSEAGKTVVKEGVTLIGTVNLPGSLSINSSQMYSRNLFELLKHLIKEGKMELDMNDDITSGCCITHDGKVVHEKTKSLLEKA